ncbi:MAG: alpha/beta fold hydrolase [Gemmatimonadaceae bacterium]
MNKSLRERILRFGPDNGLVGILTTSRELTKPDLPHVVMINAGIVHRVGPNRLYVDLARAMAMEGYPVVRIDLAGLGDSEAMTSTLSLEESALQDVVAVFDYLSETRGARTFVTAGLCSGANYSILAAFREPRVVGALLVDPSVSRTRKSMVTHVARRLRNLPTLRALITLRHPVYRRTLAGMRSLAVAEAAAGQSSQRADFMADTKNAAPAVREAIEQMLDRGVQLMMVFTGGVNYVYNYDKQLYDLLPGLDFRDQLLLLYMPETDHTVSDMSGRAKLIQSVGTWLNRAFPMKSDDRNDLSMRVGRDRA